MDENAGSTPAGRSIIWPMRRGILRQGLVSIKIENACAPVCGVAVACAVWGREVGGSIPPTQTQACEAQVDEQWTFNP